MSTAPYDQRCRIDPPPGMDREVGILFAYLEQARLLTRDSIAGLSQATLDATRPAFPNSIGKLIAHIAAAEFHWIHRVALGEPGIQSANPTWNDAPLDGPAFAALHGHDIAFYLALLDEARAKTEAACWRLENGDLELEREVRHRGPGHTCTIRYAFWRLIDHEAHHRGQIDMLLGALEREGNR